MVADDKRKVRNECGAAPWRRNERPVNDEDREPNRGEEVSNGWLVGLLGHARETDPARTVLILYPFFYRFLPRIGCFAALPAIPRRSLGPIPRDEERTCPVDSQRRRTRRNCE